MPRPLMPIAPLCPRFAPALSARELPRLDLVIAAWAFTPAAG
jgi:hypothetical protein